MLPVPPETSALHWRPLLADDFPGTAALAAACMAVDGGHPIAGSSEYLAEWYRTADQARTIGGFAGQQLVACAAVRLAPQGREDGAILVGQVHPAYRRAGIGHFLLAWSEAQAASLLAHAPRACPPVLSLATESFTDAAGRLYRQHGWEQQLLEEVMRCELPAPVPDTRLPAEVDLLPWSSDRASAFFHVYHASFREGPGFPGWGEKTWTAWATDGDDFRPELSLLASIGGNPAGFILCAGRWIVQVGVCPEWRCRGIGSGLVAEALRRAQQAGDGEALLDVNANNPGAARVYARLGFRIIGRRARFSKTLG